MLNFNFCKFLILLSKLIRKIAVLLKSRFLKKLWVKIAFFAVEARSDLKRYEHYEIESNFCKIERNIFVYWEQGLEQAPNVVRKCIHHIIDNFSATYKVHILDRTNLSEYVTFPSYINNKITSGDITKTHFSDLIRFELLRKYGGFWIDSTVLTSKNTLELIDGRSFFTLKHSNFPEYQSFNEGLWTSYFLGLPKNSNLSRFMCDSFYSYWKKNEFLLDYFLVDYYLYLAYKNIKTVKKLIDGQQDFCGNNRWLLVEVCNKSINDLDSKRISDDIYKTYKLSYKIKPNKKDGLYYHKFFE